MKKTPFERFDAKVDRSADCWEWTAYKFPNGYSGFNKGYGHRFSYEFYVGPIPAGMVIDHLCRNRGCVNPEHLETVPQRLNFLRGDGPKAVAASNSRRGAARTHCPHGHAYDEHNTLYETKKNGNVMRRCKTCRLNQRRR